MRIYLISDDQKIKGIFPKLADHGQVIFLDSGEKDINAYNPIFADPNPKILVLDPGVIDWKLPNEVIAAIPELKGICTKSAWAAYIDLIYCREKGIPVCNCPGANSRSVAEYAFWMLLSLVKRLPLQIKDDFRTRLDNVHIQEELWGKKMGIIGLGKVGAHLAQIGSAFGLEVFYWSRTSKNSPYTYTSVEKVLAECDYIFNCLEICPETLNFFSESRLVLLKPSSYFVSVLGGAGWGVEDDQFLLSLVNSRKLAGFAVENDHKPGFSFKETFSGNIFTPPAYAWYTHEAEQRMLSMVADSVIGIITGKPVNLAL